MTGLQSKVARVAALERSRQHDDPVLMEARQDMQEARIAQVIQRDAGALDEERRKRLVKLLLQGGVSW